MDDERTIELLEKDHENLSKLLPQLRETEKNRQIVEEKEKKAGTYIKGACS